MICTYVPSLLVPAGFRGAPKTKKRRRHLRPGDKLLSNSNDTIVACRRNVYVYQYIPFCRAIYVCISHSRNSITLIYIQYWTNRIHSHIEWSHCAGWLGSSVPKWIQNVRGQGRLRERNSRGRNHFQILDYVRIRRGFFPENIREMVKYILTHVLILLDFDARFAISLKSNLRNNSYIVQMQHCIIKVPTFTMTYI